MTEAQTLTVGLVLPPAYALSLSRALAGAGYAAEIASSRHMLQVLLREGHCQLWVVHQADAEHLSALRQSGARVLALETLPDSRDRLALEAWAEGLLLRISGEGGTPVRDEHRQAGVPPVWLLVGSAGATSAVQAFFAAFPVVPPLAFLYAQHFDPDKQQQLEQLALENPLFSMSLLDSSAPLVPGHVFIVPPRQKIALDSQGRLSLLPIGWGDRHAPDLNAVIAILARSGLSVPGLILFSGMGDDGSAALPQLAQAGGRIWAQDPASAICNGMPLAALATGFVSNTGTPGELATALLRLYPS